MEALTWLRRGLDLNTAGDTGSIQLDRQTPDPRRQGLFVHHHLKPFDAIRYRLVVLAVEGSADLHEAQADHVAHDVERNVACPAVVMSVPGSAKVFWCHAELTGDAGNDVLAIDQGLSALERPDVRHIDQPIIEQLEDERLARNKTLAMNGEVCPAP